MDASTLKLCAITLLLGLFTVEAHAQLPDVPRQQVHVYLLAGQSNMAGRGMVDSTDRKRHPRIWMLNKANQWVPAAEPLHFDKPDVVGVGPGLSFGRAMAEADTLAQIGLIPCAVGGSAIDSWQTGSYHGQTKSYPYDDALRRTKLALPTGTLRGILWHQGESDSKPDLAAGYAQKLIALVERFRRDLAAPNVPIVIGTLGNFYVTKNPVAARINEAIRDVPSRMHHVACVESSGLVDKGDQTHFDTPSARELGRRYAKAMQTLQSKK